MAGVNLIVSCTKRKTREARTTLRLRDLAGTATIEERARTWVRRLQAECADLIPARDLYCGDHWSVVRSIGDEVPANGQPIRVWVCSAGYGLLTPGSRLAAYEATFTPGRADSVVPAGFPVRRDAATAW